MNYLKIFGDPKNDFINHLIYKLSYEINYCINNLYNNCKNTNINKGNNILSIFQKILKEIPNWDKTIIMNETNRIKERIPIIEDLLTCVLISNTRLLCSFKNNEKIKLKIPKLHIFIHKCYMLITKELWQYTYLFNENIDNLSIQKNKKTINNIIKNNIENVIMIYLPIKKILKTYINNNLNNNQIEISESLSNILDNTRINNIKDTNNILCNQDIPSKEIIETSNNILCNQDIPSKEIIEPSNNLQEGTFSINKLNILDLKNETKIDENVLLNKTKHTNNLELSINNLDKNSISIVSEECKISDNILNDINKFTDDYSIKNNNIFFDKPIELFKKNS